MKNLKTAIFTVTLVLCGLTNVKAQDSKIVKEKAVKSNSASDLKTTLQTQTSIESAVEKRRLKTKHDTAKNSIGNIR
ncbi:hypothetical protein [Flavobacterium sp. CF136]|uniref:hypothetical protein n=1 Tax=Flavobacterium sp. (strain CF136) TaxID=1144313 RepID=UPI0002719FAC|nr:hypothetical protein [Flavobacterium sp. CF136]EJL61521.1 hypothetical protein PMI10_03349 [Flavobacterium sp. CF136]